MTRWRLGRMMDRKTHRHCRLALPLVLSIVLLAHGFPASAQTSAEPADRPVIRQLAPSSPRIDGLGIDGLGIDGLGIDGLGIDGLGVDGDPSPVRNAQFMPGMPQMPPMMIPRPGGTQSSMGGGMTMVMTGDTILEMTAGACTAGLFIGGVAAAMAAGPAAPVSASAILSSAGIGCGFAVAATAAGMVGMMGGRTLYELFQ
jgi:hypothetical protein